MSTYCRPGGPGRQQGGWRKRPRGADGHLRQIVVVRTDAQHGPVPMVVGGRLVRAAPPRG